MVTFYWGNWSLLGNGRYLDYFCSKFVSVCGLYVVIKLLNELQKLKLVLTNLLFAQFDLQVESVRGRHGALAIREGRNTLG